jgi:iron complex outermembrane receptor protein
MRRLRNGRPAAWALPVVLIALASGLAPASGEGTDPAPEIAPSGEPFPSDTVYVTGERPRPEARVERLPVFATVRDVGDATERVVTAADVLEETAGVRVRRYGGLGSFATASIRGSSAGQVELFLDGLPLNSAQWGVTNLAELPIDNLQRIEIYRSGAPVDLGGAGIGGAVNLVTQPSNAGRRLLSVSSGSYGTWKGNLLSSGRIGKLEHLVSYHRLQTRGDFEFRYDPGTRFLNEGDDEIRTRENNDFVENAALLKVGMPEVAGCRFSLQDQWFLKEGGIPGRGNLLYREARFDTRQHMIGLGAAPPATLGRRLTARLTGYHVYRRDRYDNPAKEPGLNRTDLIHRSKTSGVRTTATFAWFETGQAFTLSTEWRRDRFTPEDKHPRKGIGFTRERESLNLGIEDAWHLWRDRLNVTTSYRYQESHDNYFGPTPFFGQPAPRDDDHVSTFGAPSAGVRVVLTPDVALKANRTEQSRIPTLFELFGTGAEVRENPELVPEESVTWDAGFTLKAPRGWPIDGWLEASAFRASRDSLIYLVQTAQGAFKAMNLERSEARGIEVGFAVEIPRAAASQAATPTVRVEGSFTTQDVRHTGGVPHWNDKWLPYVSPRELFVRTTLGLLSRLSLRHEYSFFDRYYVDRANLPENRFGPRRLHNLGAKVEIVRRRLTADVDVQNVFDEKFSDVFGYPMPGRVIYLTLEIDHGPR